MIRGCTLLRATFARYGFRKNSSRPLAMNLNYSKMMTLFRQLQKILPGEVLLQPAILAKYAGDKWFATHRPDAVALPRSTESVSSLLRFADRHKIPVTARGAGHGYVGGCVPVRGGLALSTERMGKILEINPRDFVAVVQPAVNTAAFQAACERRGLFYPPDPASRADNFLGGNIATNAGGPRCLKYGVTRDYVLGLEVVLADGTICRLGGRTHKNKTGFDLHRLFVGSEGLLGIITEATLKLLPLPPYRASLEVGFASMNLAVRGLQAIFAAGFLPCAAELADEFTLAAAAQRTGSKRLLGCKAHLIVEFDGQEYSVRHELGAVEKTLRERKPLFVECGFGSKQCEAIWQIRREFSYALRDTGLTKLNEDIVVPRGKLEALFQFAAQLQKKHRLQVACFGHAGDGNIHTNVMVDYEQPGAKARAEKCLDELFAWVIAGGGAITGEHGIGLAKKRWWPQAVPENSRALHGRVKHALDPRGILNPGKFL
ncbi:MAG TPA: FAD-linked oxidase C-terminal domain-containing protein [Candidatus Acidoferrales bacterium]|nr:FAD-linked oxidase C-terminal domain-containing protein [Candidatus Acidoferrales bacterium]